MKPTISVIIPALNEEDNIEPTVKEVLSAIKGRFSGYEILIFDDGSTDNTGAISDKLAASNKNIKVIHNKSNMGLGYNYKRGVQLAENDYVILIPGDNQISQAFMTRMVNLVGKADIVIPYIENYWVRPVPRQLISKSFTIIMNFLFRLDLNYYNGTVIHKRDIIKSVPMDTTGFAYQAVTLTKLIKSGYSYVEVGGPIRERQFGFTRAFYPKNILSVFLAVGNLFWEVYFKDNKAYNKSLEKIDVAK